MRREVLAVSFPGGVALLNEELQRVHLCNETSGALWRLMAEGLTQREAAAALAEHYGMPAQQVSDDLERVTAEWAELGLIGKHGETSSGGPVGGAERPRGGDWKSHRYQLPGLCFELCGAEAKILDHLHGTLELFHDDQVTPDLQLEIRTDSSAEPFILVVDGAERLRSAKTHELTGAVFQVLLQELRRQTEWLALIHGAAVRTADGRAVVFPGNGGAGKSTLAAWLCQRGFTFISDDMVPIATEGCAVAWPLPHSIKRGSWTALADAIPELEQATSRIVNGREIKFIAPPAQAWDAPPAPVSALIFPTYDTRAERGITALSLLDTMERLFAGRMWLGESLTPARVEAFIRWLEPLPAYAMSYSTLDEAESLLRSALG